MAALGDSPQDLVPGFGLYISRGELLRAPGHLSCPNGIEFLGVLTGATVIKAGE